MINKIYYRNRNQELVYLKDVEADSLEKVFHNMQGEIWSPNGEARELIISKGLSHTSMSVGDVIVVENKYWEVDMFGFKEIGGLI